MITTKQSRWALAGLLLTVTLPPATLAADRNVPSQHPTIQAAIDASVSGDTIHIAPGIYSEQILIKSKNLTLIGSPGTVLRATGNLEQTLLSERYATRAVLAAVRSEVALRGLTFEGEHLGDAVDALTAVIFLGSSGGLEHCTVQGFRGMSMSFADSGAGDGLNASNPTRYGIPMVSVRVSDCSFGDNLRSIWLGGGLENTSGTTLGAATLNLSFALENNTIAGFGLKGTDTQIGVEILPGAKGLVKQNTITGHSGGDGGLDRTSYGILAFDRDAYDRGQPFRTLGTVRYEGNTFQNNQQHIASVPSNGSQFVNNIFQGSGVGTRPFAIGLSGKTNILSGNRFSDLPVGILLFGQDPDLGTSVGLAKDPQLSDNRFCNVATPLITEPLVTGVSEQGTLQCPFPDPALTLESAALLSWPVETQGWLLESSPTFGGAWSGEVSPGAVQGGQNIVTVKTDSTRRFFRLRKP